MCYTTVLYYTVLYYKSLHTTAGLPLHIGVIMFYTALIYTAISYITSTSFAVLKGVHGSIPLSNTPIQPYTVNYMKSNAT